MRRYQAETIVEYLEEFIMARIEFPESQNEENLKRKRMTLVDYIIELAGGDEDDE